MERRIAKNLGVGTLVVAAGALFLALEDPREGAVFAVVGEIAVMAISVWSGRRGRHTSWARAQELLGSGHAVVLWKPGCFYCERLMLQIGKDARVAWVNVWRDDAAQTRVRALNGGDELTPTVLIGEEALRNPSARELRNRLGSADLGRAERPAQS